jgi:hypothetical protein
VSLTTRFASLCQQRETFVFLDSANLANTQLLMNSVRSSSAFFLLLTRETLRRPVVLAELCCAAASSGKLIVPIPVQWPDAAKNGRDFRFPRDLDDVIEDWTLFAEQERMHSAAAKWAIGDRDLNSGRVDTVRQSVHDTARKAHFAYERVIASVKKLVARCFTPQQAERNSFVKLEEEDTRIEV